MPYRTIERVLPYEQDALMGIILDVGNYPAFLKWVTSARAKRVGPNELDADVLIGHRLFKAPVSARLIRSGNGRVDILYRRGPIRDLSSIWTVDRVASGDIAQACDGREACRVRVVVDIQPGVLLSPIVNGVFDRGLARLVESFEARAHDLYGREGRTHISGAPSDKTPGNPYVSP